MPATPLNTRLNIRYPLIQAPLAGAQGSALALAVSRAGGLGSLPAAALPLDKLREEMQAMRGSGLPWNANFFCHAAPQPDAPRQAAWHALLKPYFDELGLDAAHIPSGPGRQPFDDEAAALVAEFRPPVVSFHFGLPAPQALERIKRAGAFVLSSATTVEEALWLQAHGADAIIAQGLEAGGHRGHFLSDDLTRQAGLFALLPQVVAAVRVPVVANGDIDSPAKAAAVLAATRADAVMLGRAAWRAPWLLRQVAHYLATGRQLAAPLTLEVRSALLDHLHAHYALYGEAAGARSARKHLQRMLGGLPGGDAFVQSLMPEVSALRQWQAVADFLMLLAERHERLPGEAPIRSQVA